ncbi:MAG: GlmU family protein [Bacteroidota bacterium]
MNYILSDGPYRNTLLPITYTRPVAAIRIGILTLNEKWAYFLDDTTSCLTAAYLQKKFPLQQAKDSVVIHAAFLPNPPLANAVKKLGKGEALIHHKHGVIAYRVEGEDLAYNTERFKVVAFDTDCIVIKNTWDIFVHNAKALQEDFDLLTHGRQSQTISSTNTVIGKDVFLEEGASVEASILNATTGPIYIGKNATILEGCMIRGGFALGEHALLKMGAKIYGASTFGPYCKVGGEVNNSVLFANSNKGHEGFLGNSVLGEWCNLGADTNISNLKNNYAPVRLWDYQAERFSPTGLQFCGLIMGDHSKAGINTMFNTGTVVGVSANIFGSGFPRNFIPSFSWGGASGFITYLTSKAFETAQAMMARRQVDFDKVEEDMLLAVFEMTQKWRKG